MNWKLKEITIKAILQAFTNGEDVSLDDFCFYKEGVGYLQVNEFCFLENGNVQIGNSIVNIKNEYSLNDKIYIRIANISLKYRYDFFVN